MWCNICCIIQLTKIYSTQLKRAVRCIDFKVYLFDEIGFILLIFTHPFPWGQTVCASPMIIPP
jgi:hypothetical protein